MRNNNNKFFAINSNNSKTNKICPFSSNNFENKKEEVKRKRIKNLLKISAAKELSSHKRFKSKNT